MSDVSYVVYILKRGQLYCKIAFELIINRHWQPMCGLCMHRLTHSEPRDRCVAIPAILHLQSSAQHSLT